MEVQAGILSYSLEQLGNNIDLFVLVAELPVGVVRREEVILAELAGLVHEERLKEHAG